MTLHYVEFQSNPYPDNNGASTSTLPSYTEDPREKETRIFYVPIPNSHREIIPSELSDPPTTIFYRRFQNVCTIVVDGHPSHNNKACPVYSRENPKVSGVLTVLLNPRLIKEVTLELHGRIGRAVTLRGADSQTLFSESRSLWNPSSKKSPTSLPFSLSFPASYEDSDGTLRQLPPSYQSPVVFSPMFTARVDYYLTVRVDMARRSRYMGSVKMFHLDLHYRPSRKRAYAIWEDPEMLPKPEEWYRVSGVLEDSGIHSELATMDEGELNADFFTPGIRTYYPTQSIPFHVGLRGPSHLITQLFANERHHPKTVEVQVLRRIFFIIKTTTICKDTLITSVILDSASQWISRSFGDTLELDIAGQLTLPGLDVESLDHPHLQLSDFLVLSINPPEESGKEGCRLFIPIQLVAMA